MTAIREGDLLWEPPAALASGSNLRRFMDWLAAREGRGFADYAEVWAWSVADVGRFWRSVAEYFAVEFTRPATVPLGRREMPGAEWFPGAELNYAAHVFRMRSAARPAIVFRSETSPLVEIGWDALERDVATVAAWLRAQGVVAGDREGALETFRRLRQRDIKDCEA